MGMPEYGGALTKAQNEYEALCVGRLAAFREGATLHICAWIAKRRRSACVASRPGQAEGLPRETYRLLLAYSLSQNSTEFGMANKRRPSLPKTPTARFFQAGRNSEVKPGLESAFSQKRLISFESKYLDK